MLSIAWEAEDPETDVILLDVVLGYGVHPGPAGETAEAKRICQYHISLHRDTRNEH